MPEAIGFGDCFDFDNFPVSDGETKHYEKAAAWKAGETDERLFAVAAWWDAPYFSDAERVALALTEAMTRMSDRADPVPDAAARHYDKTALAALVIEIALINVWNRFNVTTRQVASAAAW
jgi:alkylhydroperoxidase family enzyme